ncbi:IclR family transcriptional regulator [Litoreibacter arenae]|uniref:Transcriptional regulator, IclR family n=1 Tax=Litoreibacter arenae DSM 19593 TaxID=1123360 RepID=S9QHQ9_9RHOB|nr:IclR family transcriptional regulator [Litoreibacter arenae]EPX80991.1 Transcriptional regulator, IclR family [Litoreibacter arenae DSM 19593]
MQGTQTASGTVKKALCVLDQAASFGRPVRFNELLENSPYPKGTLYRMLQTLRSEGMLSYDETSQTYSLGIRLVRLAHTAWTQSSLAPVARPFLDTLSKSIGETIHLAQLDNAQVLYVDKRNAERPVEMFSQAGKVGPAYCTGVGKAMLAFLPEKELQQALAQQSFHRFTPQTLASTDVLRDELVNIRKRGYAFDREEHEPGIICVAIPILTRTERVIGAISVTSTTSRTSLDQLEGLAPEMRQAADAIADAAEHWSFPVQQKTKETLES